MRRDHQIQEQELGDAELEAVSGGFTFGAAIDSAKSQYQESREIFRLALRIQRTYAERQSSVVRRFTG